MFFFVGAITMELKWPWCCATNLSARMSDDEQSEISAQWWLPTGGNMEDFDASFDFSVSENGVYYSLQMGNVEKKMVMHQIWGHPCFQTNSPSF